MIFISCQNNEISYLKEEIVELKTINKKLLDSINNHNYNRVYSSEFIGIPDKVYLTPKKT